MDNVTIRRLKLLRMAEGKTQGQVAAMAGIDTSYVCNAERYGMLYPKHAKAVAEALGWSGDPQDLVEMVELEERS